MASRTLPNLGLSAFWILGEDNWKDEHDLNLLKLSVLVQGGVASKVAAEPGAPTNGDVHILDETHGTQPNTVIVRDNGAWVYITPQEGWLLYNRDANYYEKFDGASWAELATGGGGGLADAPSDGSLYARRDGAWEAFTAGGGAGGGGGSPWELIAEWDGTPGTNIDLAFGSDDYEDIFIRAEGIVLAASNVRRLLLSTNGGSTFHESVGDYTTFSGTGGTSDENELSQTESATSGRSVLSFITGNQAAVKYFNDNTRGRGLFKQASPINAVRLNANGTSISSGTFQVYGRKSGGGTTSGTSFPVSPTAGDKFYRTDRNIEYFYDGTRWLSTQLFMHYFQPDDNAGNPLPSSGRTLRSVNPHVAVSAIFVEDFRFYALNTASTASNYGTFKLVKNSGAAATDLTTAISTQGDAQNVRVAHSEAVNEEVASTFVTLDVLYTPTGNPAIYTQPLITYRLVG